MELHHACQAENALQVQQLINGWTPLHYAEGNVEWMKILINAGADIHYRTPDGPYCMQ